ncbi:hypothetical protein PF004_g11581 [Phytophthora fragariae]|uniref:Uncharacterized protein n=1 Tax=Phytophthora fragariae TaxID=53985 RepID=A0A6G0NXS3_9STRA|nr:hypothetical protein PF004_g11581 [Phytophthora fragariae]
METNTSALKLFHLFDDEESEVLTVLAAYTTVVQPSPPARDHLQDEALTLTEKPKRVIAVSPLYLRVVGAMERHNRYFQQRRDATGKLGLSALQKSTAAIRQLAYGMPAGAVDEYFIRDGSVEYPEFRANSQVVPSLMFSSVNMFMSVVVRHDLPCFLQGCDGGGAGTMSEHARRGRLVSDA